VLRAADPHGLGELLVCGSRTNPSRLVDSVTVGYSRLKNETHRAPLVLDCSEVAQMNKRSVCRLLLPE